MKPDFLFETFYNQIGKKTLYNHAQFITELFIAAGSNYFISSPSKKYESTDYRYKIFNGSKPLSAEIKRSFPNDEVNVQKLATFFQTHINRNNALHLPALLESFDVSNTKEQDATCLANALALQFKAFIDDKERQDANNIVPTEYKRLIGEKKASYTSNEHQSKDEDRKTDTTELSTHDSSVIEDIKDVLENDNLRYQLDEIHNNPIKKSILSPLFELPDWYKKPSNIVSNNALNEQINALMFAINEYRFKLVAIFEPFVVNNEEYYCILGDYDANLNNGIQRRVISSEKAYEDFKNQIDEIHKSIDLLNERYSELIKFFISFKENSMNSSSNNKHISIVDAKNVQILPNAIINGGIHFS